MARRLSNRGHLVRACSRVQLGHLPGLPESLRIMILEGRQGRADLSMRLQWAADLRIYAAEYKPYIGEKYGHLKVEPRGWVPGVIYQMADAFEICTDEDLNIRGRRYAYT